MGRTELVNCSESSNEEAHCNEEEGVRKTSQVEAQQVVCKLGQDSHTARILQGRQQSSRNFLDSPAWATGTVVAGHLVLTGEVPRIVGYALWDERYKLLVLQPVTGHDVPTLLGSCLPVLRAGGGQRTLWADAEH